MSLFKQLWLALACLLIIVVGASFVISSLSMRDYMEQQLYQKNHDEAKALALFISAENPGKSRLEQILNVYFENSELDFLEVITPEGESLYRRREIAPDSKVPPAFTRLLSIEAELGIAQLKQGFELTGTLRLRGHSHIAYETLWYNTRALAYLFLAALLISCLFGSLLLRHILHPLDKVVSQAEAIGERRFISINEPGTKEFGRLVGAMNTLSGRIRTMLESESRRLEDWEQDAHVDKTSGLLNREPFMRALDSVLQSEDFNAAGSLTLVRLGGLAQLNQLFGRKAVDHLLKELGDAINTVCAAHSRWQASRIGGSDFAVLSPLAISPQETAEEICHAMQNVLIGRAMSDHVSLPSAATSYEHGESLRELMTRIDAALLSSDNEGLSAVTIAYKGDVQILPLREQMDNWRDIFNRAFADRLFALQPYAVVGSEDELLHYEAPARLHWQGEFMSAGTFLPWINRLDMASQLDETMVEQALQLIAKRNSPICINLSPNSISKPEFSIWLARQLAEHKEQAWRLAIELPEATSFAHLDNFRQLCERVHVYGCQVGIEHTGHQLSNLGQLHDIGLDYLKVDAAFVRGIDNNPANQALLRTLCTVGHSIGVKVIALGIQTAGEHKMLARVGVDGFTGPFITAQRKQKQ